MPPDLIRESNWPASIAERIGRRNSLTIGFVVEQQSRLANHAPDYLRANNSLCPFDLPVDINYPPSYKSLFVVATCRAFYWQLFSGRCGLNNCGEIVPFSNTRNKSRRRLRRLSKASARACVVESNVEITAIRARARNSQREEVIRHSLHSGTSSHSCSVTVATVIHLRW